MFCQKSVASLLAIALLISLASCSRDTGKRSIPFESRTQESSTPDIPPDPPDLSGQWKQVNTDSEDGFHGAIINEDQIEIYFVSDDTRSLYWAGSFTPPDTGKEPYSWESEVDKEKTENAVFASTDDTKTFTYRNGQISYSASAMGITSTIRLEKEEWEPGLEINTNEGSEETPNDEEAFFTVTFGGIEFSVPGYYVQDTENSEDTDLTFDASNVRLLFSAIEDMPSLTQKGFEKTSNDWMERLLNALDNSILLAASETTSLAGLPAYKFVLSGDAIDGTVKIILHMFYVYNEARGEMLQLGMILYTNNNVERYVEDFEEMLETAQLVALEPDNSSVGGIRPEFKKAMDTYEAFFDEYVEFMGRYMNMDSSDALGALSMLTEYADYLSRYSEAMDALDEIGEQDLSKEELLYYTEVMGRINQKLISVAY